MTHEFISNLALVFCVAGVTTLVFQRLRQPVIFGYLIAGFILGPHTSAIPLVADEEIVHTFAELGVILLMFSLGLEFSLRKLIKVGPAAAGIAIGETSAMMCMGYLLGRAFGWTAVESIYAGVIVAISSTTVILKAFAEQGIRERFTRLVFGVLIVEDLIAIFALTILTTISGGGGLTAGTMLDAAHDLVLFLAALIGIGILLIPRIFRAIIKLDRPETTLVASIGLCFGCALLALQFGYSVALGAFIGGSLVAESGHGKTVEHLVQPVRDMFGAMFFVAVGMLIDPQVIVQHLGAVLAMAVVVILGKTIFVTSMAVLTGQDVRTSVQTGMTMAQIGEFSFIIATLGLTLGATGEFLYPIAVAVSAITTLTTPWLIRASSPAAAWIDRKLPHRVQMFIGLYGTWFDRLRHSPPAATANRKTTRLAIVLFVDAALLAGLIVASVLQVDRVTRKLSQVTHLDPTVARWTLLTIIVFAGAFLCAGILRVTSALSKLLAHRAFPSPPEGKLDFAAAPRGAMIVTLRILMILLLGFPLIAITQPFIPLFRGSALLLLVLVALAITFWRSVSNLHGHAKAGAEVILMALSSQMADDNADEHHEAEAAQLARIREALPGLGEPVAIRLPEGSPAMGQTLTTLNLRGSTGATVLAIARKGQDILLPSGPERLVAKDVLFVAGTARAIASARSVLMGKHAADHS